MSVLTIILFVFGYPVSIVVLSQWLPVVDEQRHRWFAAHEIAVLAIVVGWIIERRWLIAAVNAVWLVVAALWYRARPWSSDMSTRSSPVETPVETPVEVENDDEVAVDPVGERPPDAPD